MHRGFQEEHCIRKSYNQVSLAFRVRLDKEQQPDHCSRIWHERGLHALLTKRYKEQRCTKMPENSFCRSGVSKSSGPGQTDVILLLVKQFSFLSFFYMSVNLFVLALSILPFLGVSLIWCDFSGQYLWQ